MEQVILVDSEDNEIGFAPKSEPHRHPTKLHRAFSLFVLNSKDQLLLQRRSGKKERWPGFWSNTCCSHPVPNEPVQLAGERRLQEELGFTCKMDFLFKFEYSAKYDDEWGENELDHVFVGYYDGPVSPNPEEIDEIKFVDLKDLEKDIAANPNNYTPWLRICFRRFLYHIGKT